jgi:hypothetical protein
LLLDECVTRDLKSDLAPAHDVYTVEEAGLKGLENGDLIRAAGGKYDVLITVDRNIPISTERCGIAYCNPGTCGKRNSYVHLRPLIPRALAALENITPGAIVLIE